jgi:hypothetical protein
MDPTDLTCGKCGKSWKLIKAGAGPVTCPHCKAPLDTRPATPTAGATPTATEPATAPPASTSPQESVPGSLSSFSDTDDPGLQADYAERDVRPRSGRNPLLRVILILVLLIVLVPVALFLLFLIVCAVMIAAG